LMFVFVFEVIFQKNSSLAERDSVTSSRASSLMTIPSTRPEVKGKN
jgi:hypothetical protein